MTWPGLLGQLPNPLGAKGPDLVQRGEPGHQEEGRAEGGFEAALDHHAAVSRQDSGHQRVAEGDICSSSLTSVTTVGSTMTLWGGHL